MKMFVEYHLWIMIAILVGLILLPQKHRKKKSVLTLIAVLALSIGYEFIMSEPITQMPSRVNQYFNQDGATKTENPDYYNNPEERLGK
jgi:NAD/NADP transhydrogenase beta subunit